MSRIFIVPARKTTDGLDGQHQDVDRTPRGRVSQNDRDKMEKVRPWCGQPWDRGRLKNRAAMYDVICDLRHGGLKRFRDDCVILLMVMMMMT